MSPSMEYWDGSSSKRLLFCSFYGTTIATQVAKSNQDLESVFIGSGIEKLDALNCYMCMMDVTSLFGPFVKFIVEEVGGGPLVVPGNLVGHVHVYVCVWAMIGCVWEFVCVMDLSIYSNTIR